MVGKLLLFDLYTIYFHVDDAIILGTFLHWISITLLILGMITVHTVGTQTDTV